MSSLGMTSLFLQKNVLTSFVIVPVANYGLPAQILVAVGATVT